MLKVTKELLEKLCLFKKCSLSLRLTSYSEFVKLVGPAQNSKGYKFIVTDVKAAVTSKMKLVVAIVFKG